MKSESQLKHTSLRRTTVNVFNACPLFKSVLMHLKPFFCSCNDTIFQVHFTNWTKTLESMHFLMLYWHRRLYSWHCQHRCLWWFVKNGKLHCQAILRKFVVDHLSYYYYEIWQQVGQFGKIMKFYFMLHVLQNANTVTFSLKMLILSLGHFPHFSLFESVKT